MSIWNERYSGEDYHFGTEPNAFLVTQKHLLKPGMSCLAVADGEGRNGVWLAGQGLDVLSVDSSSVALDKARKLAQERGVKVRFEQADLAAWAWGDSRFDVVVAIFIQFAPPGLREQMFAHIKRCLKTGRSVAAAGLHAATAGIQDRRPVAGGESLHRAHAARCVRRHGHPASART